MLGLRVGILRRVMGFKLLFIIYCIAFYLSSPYLRVFDDDRITRYIGADVDAGEDVDA